ncbi:SIMPL domain-containing protein [Colwellia sp. E2M01]|uniref:SIMPL domain-containing protein n=1 Tax=Colwellia sp. E2M01 TaxID=2841561 RepID=UPI001C082EE2|nr:SIMPL domain-containing protein [Colwellia sp. E2M01]MBU2871651.1 SIMPL domain-containing protein [Colwellia sp. E2M01]
MTFKSLPTLNIPLNQCKRSYKKIALTCLPLAFLFLPTHAFSFDDEGIEVSGEGSIVVVPDQFSLTLTITERGRVPNKLKSLVDKKSNSVVNAAISLGIKETSISSARINLRIVEEEPSIKVQGIELNNAKGVTTYTDGQVVNQQQSNSPYKTPLFELSRQVTVNFTKIEQYDTFLGDIIKINVSHISALTMNVEQRDEYYQQALLQAISHAQHKAERMAKQAGQTLGDIQFIKESSNNSYRPMYAEPMIRSANSMAHTSLTGNQTITARVAVKFDFKD